MTSHGQPCWIGISVRSTHAQRRLVEFLCTLFDWTAEDFGDEPGRCTLVRRHGDPVAEIDRQPLGLERWVTYLACPDIHDATHAVLANGGRVLVEPTARAAKGVMAVVRDPLGAVFGLWQPNEFSGFSDVIAIGYPEWFHHGSPDPAGAARFFSRVFNLQVEGTAVSSRERAEIILGRAGRGFFSLGVNIEGVEPDFRPVVLVDDLDAVESRVRQGNGLIYASGVAVPGGRATTFADPVVGAPLIISCTTESPSAGG